MFVLQLHKCIQPKLQLPSDSKIELHSVHSGVVVLLCQERRVREMPEELSSIKIDLDLISSFPPQFCAQPVCRERLRGRYLTALTRRGRQVVLEMSTVYRDFPYTRKEIHMSIMCKIWSTQFVNGLLVHYRYVSLLLYSTRMCKTYDKSTKKLGIPSFKKCLFPYIMYQHYQPYLNFPRMYLNSPPIQNQISHTNLLMCIRF